MEALPIFIDALLPAWGAILISVTLILAFGEIIPQALCSRYGLSIGAKLSIVVLQIIPQALCSRYAVIMHTIIDHLESLQSTLMDFCPFKRMLTSNFSVISNKLISCFVMIRIPRTFSALVC
ncbi:DUF21 domain-containing protein [Salix suchowensis]|nr:DUF21 domain-containing protein [Salix suchowensis]